MKIMIVAPFFLPKVGGMEKIAFNIANGLITTHGHDVFVVTSNHESKQRTEDIVDDIRVIRLAPLTRISNTPVNPLWYFQVKRIIKQEKPDFINTHSPVPYLSDMAALAARRSKIPYIASYHAGSMIKDKSLVSNVIIKFYEKIFLPKLLNGAAKAATYYPDFTEKIIKDKSKIFFAPPGVDTTTFKPSTNKKKSHPTVLFVGRIEKTSTWKGIGTLIEAMSIVAKEIPDAVLKVVGPGDAIESHKMLAKSHGIASRVVFTGSLSGKDLVKEYQDASVLVLPSESDAESFGMVLIEALACGTPVIGSKIGGIPAVIENTGGGLLVEPKNESNLASTILRLLSDNKLHSEFVSNGLKSVQKNYTWEATISRYHNAITAQRQ